MATKGLLLTGIGGFLAVLFCLEAGPAQAALLINPVSARTDNWRIEPGQSIPSNTAAYVDGLLQVTTAGLYTFTYGPSGLVRGATGHGDAINVNEFWVGASRAAAEAAGQLFCTRTLAGHCTASAAGDSFTVNLLVGAVPFGFEYHQTVGNHTLVNGQVDDSNGAYLVQIGLGTTANAGPGGSAYIGLSDNPYSSDHDFQDLTVSVTGVPEPASLALLGAGLVGIGLVRRRRS